MSIFNKDRISSASFKLTIRHRLKHWFWRITGRAIRQYGVDGDAWIVCDLDCKTGDIYVIAQGINPYAAHTNTGRWTRYPLKSPSQPSVKGETP